MKESCGCGCSCQSDVKENMKDKTLECPVCGGETKNVSQDVLSTFVPANLRKKLTGNIYLCLNPDCNTAYFSSKGEVVSVDEIKRPIWFKEGADPKIICYCNNITEEQIKKAVREHNLKSWEEIVLHYREKKNCACSKLNPTGECCTEHFYKVINDTLEELGEKKVESTEQCCG